MKRIKNAANRLANALQKRRQPYEFPAYELQQLQINIEAYNSLKHETRFPQINQIPNETDFDFFMSTNTQKQIVKQNQNQHQKHQSNQTYPTN